MIIFKRSNDNLQQTTFVVQSSTSEDNYCNDFGIVYYIGKRKSQIAWYTLGYCVGTKVIDNSLLVPVRPYYKSNSEQGEIAKDSYDSLIVQIEDCFPIVKDNIKIKMATIKKRVSVGDDVLLTDGKLVAKYGLRDIQGKVTNITNDNYEILVLRIYRDEVKEHLFNCKRSQFEKLTQDTFTVAHIVCCYCNN